MHKPEYNQSQVIKYLFWTFLPAYCLWFLAAYVYNNMNQSGGQLIIAGGMFIPALGALLAKAKLKEMGWKPEIRRNFKRILIACLTPFLFTVIGAGMYFLFFPGHFDLRGEFIGAKALQQLQAKGISYPLYVLIMMIASVTYAPFVNMFPALGEEIGWRGFLYPQLKAGFGRRKGQLIGGFLWGAWHWPMIYLIGYEYGAAAGNPAGYIGFPISGMILFCVITTGWGILHDWLYEESECIWIPSLFHGAINAAAALPFSVCLVNTGSFRLLGPSPNGILAGIPFLVCAAVMLVKKTIE